MKFKMKNEKSINCKEIKEKMMEQNQIIKIMNSKKREPHLRVAVIPYCNFNCVYCRPGGEGIAENGELMTADEIVKIIDLASKVGFRHVKFTGGEPLLRNDLVDIIKRTSGFEGIKSRCIITNGYFLSGRVKELKEAGLDYIVISLDAANPERFKDIAQVDGFQKVLDGLTECQKYNMPRVINTVLMRRNLNEVKGLSEIATKYGAKLKLIDLMDILGSKFWENEFVPFVEIDSLLREQSKRVDIEYPIGNLGTPMYYYEFKNGAQVITRNASLGTNYHETCKKCGFYPCQDAVYGARITHDGKLKRCLIRDDNLVDILTPLRKGNTKEVEELISDSYKIFAQAKFYPNAWKPKIVRR